MVGAALLGLVAPAAAKVSLYLSSDQTEALYGIKTDGLYYVREGVVNKYAMNFQHQVIPADVDHIDFTWRARPGSSVPYKLTFIHTPGPAMAAPSVNISQTGLVPTYPDKFRLLFPCTGKVAAQVETLLQITLAIRQKAPEVLNFKRRKVCKLAAAPPPGDLPADAEPAAQAPSKSVLLSSVSPSLFITLGAASASVILLVVLLAALYIRRVRKRDSQLGAGASLRSSLQLNTGEEDYMEKVAANTLVSSSDSYDTLASFTQVPVGRSEAPAWASSAYTAPSCQTEYACPLPRPEWRTGAGSRSSLGPAASPLVPPRGPHPGRWPSQERAGQAGARPGARVRPLYSREEPGSYRQYQYTSPGPGEASPYSVSSELYKHVLPQYFQFSRPHSRGSVLV